MSAAPLLFPNLGAEEGAGWRRMERHPRVRDVARLWGALFPADARIASGADALDRALAAVFAAEAERPALDFCAPGRALVPWLATEEAAALARREGVPLASPDPALVKTVHDKAFALERARARGLLPPEIAETAFALAPAELADPDTVRCRVEAAVARWPAPLGERFALKPRLGTSGRGRLMGRAGRLDPAALRGALARLRMRGGCVVEPWLARSADLSVQLLVAGPAEVRVLGTFAQVLTVAGVPLGHRGRIGADCAAESTSPWDGELRSAALALARDAAAAGFRGPCGVDAFVFTGAEGHERLRPVVELNARFTTGTVAAGWIARALRARVLRPGSAFYLGADPATFAGTRIELLAAPCASALFSDG